MTSRRELIKVLPFAGIAYPALSQTPAAKGPHTLPPLPYAFDALEPHIDAKTMEIHHDRHHATYVTNLNNALASDQALAGKPLPELMASWQSAPESIRNAIRNSGGGHVNHSFFWPSLSKSGGGKPKGELLSAIEKKFGSYDAFKDQFTKAATGIFGSGWAWLSIDKSKALQIETTPNQDNPWMQGRTPVVGLDVWEHAYYLKYQNKRADYITAWWNVVNWDYSSEKFSKG